MRHVCRRRPARRAWPAPLAFLATAAALICLSATPGSAEDAPAGALELTVRPSGTEEGRALDERLARRERSFRFICTGCVAGAGPGSGVPFEPLRTLNAPGLARALAGEPSDQPPDTFAPAPP